MGFSQKIPLTPAFAAASVMFAWSEVQVAMQRISRSSFSSSKLPLWLFSAAGGRTLSTNLNAVRSGTFHAMTVPEGKMKRSPYSSRVDGVSDDGIGWLFLGEEMGVWIWITWG